MTKLSRETCRADGCSRKRHYSNGLCTMHHKRLLRTGTTHRDTAPTQEKPNEVWMPVPGLEERYEASTRGRLRWVGPNAGRTVTGRVVRGSLNQDGYRQIRPFARPDRRCVRVHQLVALTFLGPRPDGLQVNHIDGNRENNAPWNLEYVTHADNIRHAHALGNVRRDGEHNSRAKLTEPDVREIRRLAASGVSQYALAKRYEVGQTAISRLVQRKSWQNVF